MPPRTNAADEKLIAAYSEAAFRIQRELNQATPSQRTVILRRIDSILAQLEELSATYLSEHLPDHFKDGSNEAIKILRNSAGFGVIDTTFGTLHHEAIQELVKDSTLKFANALEGVRREAASAISQAKKQQIMRELVQSQIDGESQPSKRVRIALEQDNIIAIRSQNRSWNLEDYASMLTNTILANAHNTGASTRYLSNGVQFGEVIERADAPDRTCEWMRGKIVFLGDPRLYGPFHPNCMGGVKPFLGKPENPITSPDDPRIPAEVRRMLLRR